MPNADTMEIKPIRQLVLRYLQPNTESVDPFARNCTFAKWRNDLNPGTGAEYHMDVLDFLQMCQTKVAADLVLFDPPYSLTQMKRSYESFGASLEYRDTTRHNWKAELRLIHAMLKVGGIIISFGWTTAGMWCAPGQYEVLEYLCVCHGAMHHDTLIVVERKVAHQEELFKSAA